MDVQALRTTSSWQIFDMFLFLFLEPSDTIASTQSWTNSLLRSLSLAPAVVVGGGIPRELDEFLVFLGRLKTFACEKNPWVETPAAVLGDGNVPAVRSYFLDLYREERVVSRSLKVVLVGKQSTGKTRRVNVC